MNDGFWIYGEIYVCGRDDAQYSISDLFQIKEFNCQHLEMMSTRVLLGWRREYRSANVGRRHENINTKCALYTLYAWIINSFVQTRAHISTQICTQYAFTLARG